MDILKKCELNVMAIKLAKAKNYHRKKTFAILVKQYAK